MHTKKFNILLAALSTFAACSTEAIIHKYVVLKSVHSDGQTRYLHFLGDVHDEMALHHAHSIFCFAKESGIPLPNRHLVVEAVRKRLVSSVKEQGSDLQSFIANLPGSNATMINEDMSTRVCPVTHFPLFRGGHESFLHDISQRFYDLKWPCINAECRFFNSNHTLSKLREQCNHLQKEIAAELEQDQAPQIYKQFWTECLQKVNTEVIEWFNQEHDEDEDTPEMPTRELVDARTANFIWQHREDKHLFIAQGSGHIDAMVKFLLSTGDYHKQFEQENPIGDETASEKLLEHLLECAKNADTTCDLSYFDIAPLDLRKCFAKVAQQIDISTQAPQEEKE